MLEVRERGAAASRRGTVFACVLALLCALGALQAAGASALGEQCSGKSATGLGSFLQTQAQQAWGFKEAGFNGSGSPLACSGSQGSGGKPSVNYVPVNSPGALRAWGAEDGALHTKELGFSFQFIGTDIAPSGPVGSEGSMLAKMKAALGSDLVVVPVTQTAIAIAAHPPQLPAHPACTVGRINNVQLQKVFSGELKNWRQLNAASDPTLGGDCDQAITRIVRDESSGTTYQFKHYLNTLNPAPLACTGKEKRTWAQLQAPFGGETSPNQEWPRSSSCQEGEGPLTVVSGPIAEGGGGPLGYVRDTPGTITYGSLPEAQQQAPKQVIDVFNGVKYAGPENGEGGAACGAAKYTRPAGWEGGVNLDWSGVYGSDPSIGEVAKNAYPICTLTYDVAAANHFSAAKATTVHDYLAFAVDKEGGQAAVRSQGYHDLPAGIAKAANAAVAHIDGEEAEEEGGGEEEGGEEEGGEEEGGEEEGGGGEEEGGGKTGTVLCQVEPELVEGVLTCPEGQGFSALKLAAKLLPETVATFESASGPEGTITCTEGGFVGAFNEDGTAYSGGVFGVSFGQAEGCTTTFPEGPEAVVSFENPPYDGSRFQYVGASAPQGAFTLAKANEGLPLLRVQSDRTCVYVPQFIEVDVVNGSPTTLKWRAFWQLIEEFPENACPGGLRNSARFALTSALTGEPLYIAGK